MLRTNCFPNSQREAGLQDHTLPPGSLELHPSAEFVEGSASHSMVLSQCKAGQMMGPGFQNSEPAHLPRSMSRSTRNRVSLHYGAKLAVG